MNRKTRGPETGTPPGLEPEGGALLNDPIRSVVDDGDRANSLATSLGTTHHRQGIDFPSPPTRKLFAGRCPNLTREELRTAVHQAVITQGARPHGDGELRFRCPERARHEHDDADWSADWNRDKGVWRCWACDARGGILDLARRLGIFR